MACKRLSGTFWLFKARQWSGGSLSSKSIFLSKFPGSGVNGLRFCQASKLPWFDTRLNCVNVLCRCSSFVVVAFYHNIFSYISFFPLYSICWPFTYEPREFLQYMYFLYIYALSIEIYITCWFLLSRKWWKKVSVGPQSYPWRRGE